MDKEHVLKGSQMIQANQTPGGNNLSRGGASSCSVESRANPDKVLQTNHKFSEAMCPNPHDLHAKLCGNLRAQETMKSLEKRQIERGQRKPTNFAQPGSTQSIKSYPMEQLGRNVIMKFLHNGLKESEERESKSPGIQPHSTSSQIAAHPTVDQSQSLPEQAQACKKIDVRGTDKPVEAPLQVNPLACDILTNSLADSLVDIPMIERKVASGGNDDDTDNDKMLVDPEPTMLRTPQAESLSGSKRPASPACLGEQPSPKRSKPISGIAGVEVWKVQNLDNPTSFQHLEMSVANDMGNGGQLDSTNDTDKARVCTADLNSKQAVVDIGHHHPGG